METIELIPLSGIRYRDKMIALTATPQEVETLLGAPYARHHYSLYYFQNELHENGLVAYRKAALWAAS